MHDFIEHADGVELAGALADHVAMALERTIRRHGKAVVALSGGRTPARFLEALSGRRLPWKDVIATLVDERWVPETSDRSNAALVRRHLLRGPARAADFLPLWQAGSATPEDGLAATERAVGDLPLPLSAVVLGMGDDGHTASFFPGGDRLAEAVSPSATRFVLPMRAPAAGEPRITLTLPVILAADQIILHIEGEGKRRVLEQALAGDDILEMPVRAVLHSGKVVRVMWCP